MLPFATVFDTRHVGPLYQLVIGQAIMGAIITLIFIS